MTNGRSQHRVSFCLILLIGCASLVFYLPRYEVPSWLPLAEYTLILVVTPTYVRPHRIAELTRMSNTLTHIPHLHWIVVEDGHGLSSQVEELLRRTQLPYTYIAARTPKGTPKRGWWQRDSALRLLRERTLTLPHPYSNGVVYFADDDNSYDVRLFTHYIRRVRRAGVWAVGLVGQTMVESPRVSNGSVIGWDVEWGPNRSFATDMAGFAVSLQLIVSSNATFGVKCDARVGYGAPEPCFLERLGLKPNELEPFGTDKDTNRDIFVWHTRTANPDLRKWKGRAFGYKIEEKRKK